MSNLTTEELEILEKLSRLRLTENEKNRLLENLKKILSYAQTLNEVDTEGVKPCYHVIPSMKAPLRGDEPKRLIPREEFLRGAPDKIGGMIKVPQVIKDEL